MAWMTKAYLTTSQRTLSACFQAATGGAITVRDGNKAYCTPVQVVERMRRLYRTTNRASGWTYNGGRLEVTVQAIPPSPATVDLQQLGDRMFSATIAGSDALRHSQTSHDDRFKLRHTGNLSENRMWNVHDGSVPHVSRWGRERVWDDEWERKKRDVDTRGYDSTKVRQGAREASAWRVNTSSFHRRRVNTSLKCCLLPETHNLRVFVFAYYRWLILSLCYTWSFRLNLLHASRKEKHFTLTFETLYIYNYVMCIW